MLTEPANRENLVDRAREFLVERVTEQAMLERAPLSDTEKSMLKSSPTASQPDRAAGDALNDRYKTEKFEEKIIGLVCRARAFDRRHQRAFLWQEALHAAKGEDFYLATIIAQRGFSQQFKERTSYKDVLWLIAITVVLVSPYVYSKDFHLSEDWGKALFLVCLLTIAAVMRLALWSDRGAEPEALSLFGPQGLGRWPRKRGSHKRKSKSQDDQSA
jgi:hypothetical protein